jgi:MinD superfamily P-loop ATPase
MKQLVVLSGKGGTGKTSLVAALAHLAHAGPFPLNVVLADADVDAANLELVLEPMRMQTHDFTGGSVALIDPAQCQGCGNCTQACRFEAIRVLDGGTCLVDPLACEGCAACKYQCPEGAIQMLPQLAGQWYASDSRYGPLYHAELYPGQENSGKLVTLVKQNARMHALDHRLDALLVDGPPGTGCPVISAAAGAALALIVTEPTSAGIHDLQRILETTRHFRLPALVVTNKADLYPPGVAEIDAICQAGGVEVIGSIPFDPLVTQAMRQGQPVTAYQPASPASQAILAIWRVVVDRLHAMQEN